MSERSRLDGAGGELNGAEAAELSQQLAGSDPRRLAAGPGLDRGFRGTSARPPPPLDVRALPNARIGGIA